MAKQDLIDVVRLKELVDYDSETGIFTWKPRKWAYGAKAGTEAGWRDWKGYVIITLDRVNYRAHRLAWLYMTGEWPSQDVDHKDRNKANNRWINLREATRSQNMGNQSLRDCNTSGVKGVSWDKKRSKWQAYCRVNGVYVLKKRFDTLEEAAAAYKDAAEKHFGEFARLG